MKKNSAATMKDEYIKLLEQGYKPEDLKKFTDEMTKKTPSQVKDVKPTPTMKMKTPGAIGSVEEDIEYLKGNDFGSQKLAMDGNCPIKDGKNPDASEDVEYLKKNDFSKTAKDKNPEASEDLEALRKNNFSKKAGGLFPPTKYLVSIYIPQKNEDGTYTQNKSKKEITANTPNEAAKKFVSEVLKESPDSLVLKEEHPVKNGDSVSRVWSTLLQGYGQKLWVREVEPMRVGGSSKKAAKLDTFVEQYLVSALWSSTDDTGEPLDKEHGVSDFAPEAIQQAVADCNSFKSKAGDLIAEYDETDVAHDFWLTRNGHGAGFWDGDYEAEVGKKLTEIAKSFGESSPYIGDDGKIYLYQG